MICVIFFVSFYVNAYNFIIHIIYWECPLNQYCKYRKTPLYKNALILTNFHSGQKRVKSQFWDTRQWKIALYKVTQKQATFY